MRASPKPFRATLMVSPFPDGVTWWLDHSFSYHNPYGSIPAPIHIPSNFITDFASCPAIVASVFPRWSTYGPAALVHDWLYWIQTAERHVADAVFLEAMTLIGVPKWKRVTLYAAVRVFGGFAWADNARQAKEGYSRIRGGREAPPPRHLMKSRLGSALDVALPMPHGGEDRHQPP